MFLLEMELKKYFYWSEDDKAFIAEAPELAGGIADGRTYQEALANAETIISRMA